MSRTSKILEKLNHLTDLGVIVSYVRMDEKWLIHTHAVGKDLYLTARQVEAFINGAYAALNK